MRKYFLFFSLLLPFIATGQTAELMTTGITPQFAPNPVDLKINSFNENTGLRFSPENAETEKQGRSVWRDFYQYGKDYLHDGCYLVTSPLRMTRKQAVWVGATFLVGGVIYAYDEPLLDGFRRRRNESWYQDLQHLGDEIETYGLAATMNPWYVAGILTGYAFKFEWLEETSVQLHEAMFFGSIIRQVFVHLVGRARPFENRGPYSFRFDKGSSFFSGHTTNVFEAATIISHQCDFWPVTVLSYGLASVIGLQRLQAYSHWPSDVYLGAIYGTVVARTLIKLHENRKLKLVPARGADLGVGVGYSF